jgi:hypothetical protein
MFAMATPSQRSAVILAFVAAALSFAAAAITFFKTGQVRLTPLAGGVFMVALGISGLAKLRQR